ncbi:hypothetical protein EVAR_49547_1 [Eumeta japonica]|uniref:Uncharacterized protein n=1 Tax=Eumeta variegata TaxID=151549 RepID=A0A4C1XLW6_EUMVA|nr:hypothetical protein EVAR_49547_1 [Eumeta japonica]
MMYTWTAEADRRSVAKQRLQPSKTIQFAINVRILNPFSNIRSPSSRNASALLSDALSACILRAWILVCFIAIRYAASDIGNGYSDMICIHAGGRGAGRESGLRRGLDGWIYQVISGQGIRVTWPPFDTPPCTPRRLKYGPRPGDKGENLGKISLEENYYSSFLDSIAELTQILSTLIIMQRNLFRKQRWSAPVHRLGRRGQDGAPARPTVRYPPRAPIPLSDEGRRDARTCFSSCFAYTSYAFFHKVDPKHEDVLPIALYGARYNQPAQDKPDCWRGDAYRGDGSPRYINIVKMYTVGNSIIEPSEKGVAKSLGHGDALPHRTHYCLWTNKRENELGGARLSASDTRAPAAALDEFVCRRREIDLFGVFDGELIDERHNVFHRDHHTTSVTKNDGGGVLIAIKNASPQFANYRRSKLLVEFMLLCRLSQFSGALNANNKSRNLVFYTLSDLKADKR